MALLPKVKLKAMLSFPSSVIDGAGVDVTRVNGAFKLDLAFDDFAPPVTGIADPAHTNALLWNSTTNAYTLAPVTILGSGGAVPEAPNDGTQYGRQSLNWTPVISGVGPAGPTGPIGPTGPTGPTGPAGTAGLDGSGAGANYLFSTSTSSADPGSGNFGFNNVIPPSATAIFISETTNPGNQINTFIQSWDDSTNSVKGTLVFLSATVASHFAVFDITGSVTDNGTWDTIGVTWIQGGGGFTAGERVQVFFSRTGDKGAAGAGSGDMLSTNNLSDVAVKSTGRTNMGIGLTDTPAFTQVLLSGAVSSGTNAATKDYVTSVVPAGATVAPLINATTAVIGVATKYAREDHVHPTDTSRQVADAFLTSIATLGTAADKIIYTTGVDTAAETPLTAFARTFLDDANAAAVQTTLGLGTAAVKNTGTSGNTVPLLDADNTWTGIQGYAETALTYTSGGTTAWDVDVAPVATVAMATGNTTMGAPTNVTAGRVYTIRFVQDSSPRTAAWNAAYRWNGGASNVPVISTGSGAVDRFTFIGRASNVLEEIGRAQAIA